MNLFVFLVFSTLLLMHLSYGMPRKCDHASSEEDLPVDRRYKDGNSPAVNRRDHFSQTLYRKQTDTQPDMNEDMYKSTTGKYEYGTQNKRAYYIDDQKTTSPPKKIPYHDQYY